MRIPIMSAAALAAGLLTNGAHAAPAVTGDYVEARSSNVFVGACHREGELLTAGRNAVLAWSVTGGSYRGVELNGLKAVAVVAADKHLSFADARRESVLYVSEDATPEQREALVAMLKERAVKALGTVAVVKAAPITFDASGDLYRVHVASLAYMKIKKAPGQLCCKQPYEQWDKPFVPVADYKPGFCVGVEYKDTGLLKAWSASEQNNAYFGQFSL